MPEDKNPKADSEETIPKKAGRKFRIETQESETETETQATPEMGVEESKSVTSFSQLDTDTTKSADTVEPAAKAPGENKPLDLTKEPETAPLESEQAAEETSSEEIKDWLKDVRPDTTKEVQKSGGELNVKVLFIFLLVLALIGAAVGGVFYYKSNVNKDTSNESNTAPPSVPQTTSAPSPTQAVSATPVPADLSEYKVTVLNGSGIPGTAGTVRSALEEGGFEGVTTGNASSYDFNSTEVSMKENTPEAVFNKIKELLEDNYPIVLSEDNLPENSNYDVVITVGVKKT